MTEPPSPWAEIVGPCYTIASFAGATGMTAGAVQTAATKLCVLALTTADGDLLLPSFQVRDGRVVPHLHTVLEALRRGIEDPWTWAQWLNADAPEGRHIDKIYLPTTVLVTT